MSSAGTVSYVECPRDAWQGLPHIIPGEAKRAHLQALIDGGFTRLDAGSFVSPRAVPQMADTEAVVAALEVPAGVDLLCIIANERGVERAALVGPVTSVGYPLSVNETFQRRNVGYGLEESWQLVARLMSLCDRAGLELVIYLSMAFGNPYRDAWTPANTAVFIQRLRDMGVARIALADTVGNATPAVVDRVLGSVSNAHDLGLHLHARPDSWHDTVVMGLKHGLRWIEGALGGIGGCPFAGDTLVGNLPTEAVLPWLEAQGYDVGMEVTPAALSELVMDAADLARRYGSA